MAKATIQNYINHIIFVLDESGSIVQSGLTNSVIKVYDEQVKFLAKRSKELNQETRVSVFSFNETVRCIIYDTDVLRLPSISAHYRPVGGTALIDATLVSLEELQHTPQKYGDHSFLVYVLTDGEENRSHNNGSKLNQTINGLPDNWTVAVLVPNQNGVFEAKRFGFPANNIQVWDTTSKRGVEEVGNVIQRSTEAYFMARASGVRSTKNLFQLDSKALSSVKVSSVLNELSTKEYQLLPVRSEAVIKPFVESWTQSEYRVGSAYYQLTKPEIIQAYKQVVIQNKLNGKVYSGSNARQLLGLPSCEIKVSPTDFTEYDIFVQSTSTNRKLVRGTKLIVLK